MVTTEMLLNCCCIPTELHEGEVLHDDGHEEVQEDVRGDRDESHEVKVGDHLPPGPW
jgi:hypothetical protein